MTVYNLCRYETKNKTKRNKWKRVPPFKSNKRTGSPGGPGGPGGPCIEKNNKGKMGRHIRKIVFSLAVMFLRNIPRFFCILLFAVRTMISPLFIALNYKIVMLP